MAKRKRNAISSDNSWRMIEQSGIEGISPQSKKRRSIVFLKMLFLTISMSGVIVLLAYCIFFYKNNTFSGLFSPPIKSIIIESDGPLTKVHLTSLIDIPEGTGIMELDIFQLQKRIEGLAQVRNVIVERCLPETIKITISEYKPIVKILAMDKNGIQGLLVSEEGHVFKGYGYTTKKLKYLPYLTGVSLRKSKGSFKKIAHMYCLSELLRSAQLESPHLYKYWQSISLQHCQGRSLLYGAFIKVKTKNIGEIVFAPEKFELQLSRLNSIVSYASSRKLATIERIDLSLESQAAVKVATTQ